MSTEAGGHSGEQFEIAFGDQRATVVEIGGGLRSYSAGGRELLDGYPADAPSDVGPRAGADPVAEPARGRQPTSSTDSATSSR